MVHDVCIIGGGIVGLATAMAVLEKRPGASVVLLEKEAALAIHQTGHNSGVIHAGIYYAPGSLKARLCRQGAEAIKSFCSETGVPFEECGKLVVATNELEHQRLKGLADRAKANGIRIDWLDREALLEREPMVDGVAAILVHATGIVDYKAICKAMGDRLAQQGVQVELGIEVSGIRETADAVEITAGDRHWQTRQLIACAGLQSDRLARLAGLKINHQIIPFRGEYFKLPASRNGLVQHLIYPVPDPALPFLGIHVTKMIDGSLTVGPNAVLGMAREGYRKFSVNLRDVTEYASFPGLWRLLWNNAGSAVAELRDSLSKKAYLDACRKYCPSLTLDDLHPTEAGIRAQAVMRDGRLEHDFLFLKTDRMLHVCNAPSPAATSSIPIGRDIVERCFPSHWQGGKS
ncbi:L-2-hydroxyglutarate oxidase [Rhizobium sp. SYY.PMSO]|uniref:L-2-hydroxyglutarate oxidase n=1 Tax=Rhizobium sp. SYY.PMSO TaxID=3382192 RepID=UPI00399036F1